MKKEWIQKIEENVEGIRENEPMSNHTTFKIGGKAEVLVIAKTIEPIQKVQEIARQYKVPIYIIGNGSNILVKDGGIKGIVLKIQNDNIDIIRENEQIYIKVDAGVKLAYLAQKLMQEEISGFEFAAGIPGTIGGAIRMNAGAHGKEMKDIVVKTTYLDEDGKIKEINLVEHNFQYRNSIFSSKKYIILQTTLCLEPGKKEKINQKMEEYKAWRKANQPIEYPSAGSTFKRGEGFITAMLIDQCGLKGYKIGGAEVSEKHAGFIINTGNATAKDVLQLIEYIRKTVYEKFEKDIKLEIEVIGED